MLRVLATTASRALLGAPGARSWLLERYARALPRYDVLVTGDASSDVLALSLAYRLKVPSYSFALTGSVTMNKWAEKTNPIGLSDNPRWANEGERERHHPKRWPLIRNESMVVALTSLVTPANAHFAHLTKRTPKHVFLKMLGCCCPWAETHGTEHTLALATKAGLLTRKRTCSSRLGPPP